MKNDSSVRKSLLVFPDNRNVSSGAGQHIQSRQQRYMTARQIHQARINEQQKLRQKYGGLKDKSLILRQLPLALHEQWLSELDNKLQAIYPQSHILLAWNFFMLIAILFNFFEIPMALFLTSSVYEDQINTSIGLAINIIFLLGFYADIIVFGFNTAYYQKGKLITKRNIIAKKYLKIQFWIDLISTLILSIYIGSKSPKLVYLKIFYYIKIYSLFQKDKLILHSLQLYRISYAVYRLLRMVLFLWFITTWSGCIFFAIDYYYYNQQGYYYETDQLWLINSAAAGNLNLIQNFSWYVWYQYGLYWALQTSSTIGYGDLTPMNPPEVLFCCFVMLLMTVLFAFFINTVWEIISELQLSTVEYSENWQNLKIFLGGQKVPVETKQKISNYLYEVWQDNDNDEIEEIINQKLSKELREQFYMQSRAKFFDSFQIFSRLIEPGSRDAGMLGELAHLLSEVKIGEGESIYQVGNFSDSIYYLRKGKVKLQIEGSSLGQQLKYYQSFGSIQFFLRIPRTHTATAIIFCKLWTLSYQSLHDSFKKYLFVYEKFCEITQKMLLTRNITVLGLQCWSCKSSNHFLGQCHQVSHWRSQISHQQQTLEDRGERLERFQMKRKAIISRKVIEKQAPIFQKQNFEIDQITHTKYYIPYFNIK